jgi:hypothetical protein
VSFGLPGNDPSDRSWASSSPAKRTARNRAIASARIQLAVATSRRLNRAAIIRIDAVLGLPASDPTLGVE